MAVSGYKDQAAYDSIQWDSGPYMGSPTSSVSAPAPNQGVTANQAVQAGSSVITAMSGYRQARQNTKYARRMQAYNNKMVALGDAINQNAITNNVNQQMSKFAMAAVELKANSLQTQGAAEVAASAAGVEGNSVMATVQDIQANAASREYNRQRELTSMFISASAQRLSSTWSARLQTDKSYIPGPSLMAYVMKAGDNAAAALSGGAKGG